jgi:hypothetical protein
MNSERGCNAAVDFADCNVAERRGEKAAVIVPLRTITDGEFRGWSPLRFAAFIKSEIGKRG